MLSYEEHIAAAREPLQNKPYRYWVCGFKRADMKKVVNHLNEEFGGDNLTTLEYHLKLDHCVIFNIHKSDKSLDELREIAKRRDRLLQQGAVELPV